MRKRINNTLLGLGIVLSVVFSRLLHRLYQSQTCNCNDGRTENVLGTKYKKFYK